MLWHRLAASVSEQILQELADNHLEAFGSLQKDHVSHMIQFS